MISVGGTSASTPAFAAMVSLLNEARLQKGKPALGFLNPWLYGLAAEAEEAAAAAAAAAARGGAAAEPPRGAFTPITRGTNAISRGGAPLKYGYNCTSSGWSPGTGLGVPDFKALLTAATAA